MFPILAKTLASSTIQRPASYFFTGESSRTRRLGFSLFHEIQD